MKRVTILFGGTFNPFHIGHYEMTKALCALPEAEKVLIMPDKIPPHKTSAFLVADDDRINMCRLVAKEIEKAELLLIEFEREGKSYTYDTVRELKSQYPDTEFFMACGGDMIASLDKWYRFEELIKEIGFYAFRRKGENGFDESVERFRRMGAQIRVVDADIPCISSTELRAALKSGENTDMLPKVVYEYIAQRKLYI